MKTSSDAARQLLTEGQLVHAEIEATGVRVNMPYLRATTQEITDKVSDLVAAMKKSSVYRLWEREFGTRTNLDSPKQLAKILFDKLGHPVKYRTDKTQQAKTDKLALDHIDLPFVRKYETARNLNKTLKTYLAGISRHAVRHADGEWYVHCNYNLNVASTYRSTCNDINFQNVPKRDEGMSRFVRRCYLPLPGHHMVEIDFSTLEVRVAYCYHKDPRMETYLRDKSTDMHRDTAADLFKLPLSLLIEHAKEAKKTVRDSAKNQFVFPEFYGSVWFQCAQNIWEAMGRKKWTVPGGKQLLIDYMRDKGIRELGSTDPRQDPQKGTFAHHVREVERKLWKRFSVYDKWKREWFEQYQRRGWFEMFTGFVVSTQHSRNDVINYPVQGAAFHCLMWCLIQLNKWIRKYDLESRIVGQIHDCMVLSVSPAELQDVLTYCHWLMTVALPRAWKWICIPMETESEVADVDADWSEERAWKKGTNDIWTAA